MSLDLIVEILLVFVGLWPIVTAGAWVAGGLLFSLLDEYTEPEDRDRWPGITVLIPAYNEEPVIATSVRAALARATSSSSRPTRTPTSTRWR